MSDLRQIIEQSPVGTMFSREGLLRAIDEAPAPDGPENVSTVQASRTLGRSPKWWRMRCGEGVVEGAYQDDGRWYFPLRSGRAYLLRRANQQTPTRRGRRGPNKAQTAEAPRARAAAGEKRPVLDRRPSAVAGPALHRDP
jgi:hypothetical protein